MVDEIPPSSNLFSDRPVSSGQELSFLEKTSGKSIVGYLLVLVTESAALPLVFTLKIPFDETYLLASKSAKQRGGINTFTTVHEYTWQDHM